MVDANIQKVIMTEPKILIEVKNLKEVTVSNKETGFELKYPNFEAFISAIPNRRVFIREAYLNGYDMVFNVPDGFHTLRMVERLDEALHQGFVNSLSSLLKEQKQAL